ncbi:MAG TPA: arsenate reductase ArsC [Chthoniobacterales bacterium]|jgi:arsenate reductase|nr:arsenate reductase ArsC [Chthoniobacterales bacterium]
MKKKVLFICVHNSARSQMAAALLNQRCGEFFEAQSAGLEPGTLNPLAVEVLREMKIDISKNKTQAVFDVFKSGELFAYVITVCDESEAKGCPIFPGVTTRLHWSFPDPSKFTGAPEENIEQTRRVRDTIDSQIRQFCAEHRSK